MRFLGVILVLIGVDAQAFTQPAYSEAKFQGMLNSTLLGTQPLKFQFRFSPVAPGAARQFSQTDPDSYEVFCTNYLAFEDIGDLVIEFADAVSVRSEIDFFVGGTTHQMDWEKPNCPVYDYTQSDLERDTWITGGTTELVLDWKDAEGKRTTRKIFIQISRSIPLFRGVLERHEEDHLVSWSLNSVVIPSEKFDVWYQVIDEVRAPSGTTWTFQDQGKIVMDPVFGGSL